MPRKTNYRKRKSKPRKKKTSKPFQVSRRMRINAPLMPRTRLVKMRYVTRIQLDPMVVESGAADTANNMIRHTFCLNNLNDPDDTSNAVSHHSRDGAPNHQPRMYDQYSEFYQYVTVVGAKLNAIFTTRQHNLLKYTQNTAGQNIGKVPCVFEPEPCYVGILKHEYEENDTPSVRLDDVLEKNHMIYKKTGHKAGTYFLQKKWSLKKDPLYKTELTSSHSGGSDVSWGSQFGHDIATNNMRYCHLVAAPVTITDEVNPQPIDVCVTIDYICLLSDLKDIAQSN